MTAKDKQISFIRTSLKPLLKTHGYATSSQTWWKDKGEFFDVINLQNFSWNSKDNLDFCFNIGIALKKLVEREERKTPTWRDMVIQFREGKYLPDATLRKFGNSVGYTITTNTPLEEFFTAVEYDFVTYILPKLDELKSLDDWLRAYGDVPFWGERLKTSVQAFR